MSWNGSTGLRRYITGAGEAEAAAVGALGAGPDALPRGRARAGAADRLLGAGHDHVVARVRVGVEGNVRHAAVHAEEAAAGVRPGRPVRRRIRCAAAARVPGDLVRPGAEHRRPADADRVRARRRVLDAREARRDAVDADHGRAERARVTARDEQRLALRGRLQQGVERVGEAGRVRQHLALTRREARLLRGVVGHPARDRGDVDAPK